MTNEFYNEAKVVKIIADYCAEYGIGENDFADLIQVHPTHLSRIKAGKMCSEEALCKIAALGKVQMTDLLREIPARIKTEIISAGRSKNLPVFV